jgi:hypothetical protein
VHEGSVRDGYDWRALPWQPGDPVIDPEAEKQRKLMVNNRDRHPARHGGVDCRRCDLLREKALQGAFFM